MAKMMNPELEVVRFENEDVISASLRIRTQRVNNEDGTYTIQYNIYGPNSYYSTTNANEAANFIDSYYSPNGQGSGRVGGAEGQTTSDWINGIDGTVDLGIDYVGNSSGGEQLYNVQ